MVTKIAVDRSMRRVDADGHMHVELTNISKANVCSYFGREIPEYQALGLQPGNVYRLYRHPAELAAAADTFAGKPLLLHHTPVTADAPAPELVVGTVGTTVRFNPPYLQAPLSLWTQEAIDAVDSGEQRELSPGYRYRADMTSGHTPEGVAFDGVMRDIKGNHVALVAEGRTGPDVMVADESPPEFNKMKFSKLMAALAAVLPSMSHTSAVALDSALTQDLWGTAADDLTEDEMTAACAKHAKDSGKEVDKLSDEDKAEAYRRAAADKINGASASRAPSASEGSKPPHAADAAAVQLAVDAALAAAKADADKLAADARAEVHALYAARKAVEPSVGVVAMDSAEQVYRFALDHLKVDHKDTAAAGLGVLYDQSVKAAVAPAPIAQDAAAAYDIATILGISHIRKG